VADPQFLLDSNICIYLLEGLSEPARNQVEARQPGEVVTSAIAYAEVMRGVDQADGAAVAKTKALFQVVLVLPFGREEAEAYRQMPFRRTSYDRLIAAHAFSLGLTLVTNNVRDFRLVEGLKVANWTKA
jgi:tRNA(fMet)-specific endonuclease VapC